MVVLSYKQGTVGGNMIQKNKNIIARKIHDSFFLINIKENYLDDKCRLYEINEIGDFIWRELDSATTIPEVVEGLLSVLEEGVDCSVVYQDVEEFINTLLEEGFLEVQDGRN